MQGKRGGSSLAQPRKLSAGHWVSAALAIAHTAYIAAYSARVWHDGALPHRLHSHHSVYHNLEGSAGRILMPHKRAAFPVLASDALRAAEVQQGSELPQCVGVGRTGWKEVDGSLVAGGPLTEMPLWALPDDNAGLEELAQGMVCELLSPCWC